MKIKINDYLLKIKLMSNGENNVKFEYNKSEKFLKLNIINNLYLDEYIIDVIDEYYDVLIQLDNNKDKIFDMRECLGQFNGDIYTLDLNNNYKIDLNYIDQMLALKNLIKNNSGNDFEVSYKINLYNFSYNDAEILEIKNQILDNELINKEQINFIIKKLTNKLNNLKIKIKFLI